MNTAVNVNVVHESEAQRQHARVRIPAKLRYLDGERQTHEVKVEDLSAGGLSFFAKQPLQVGQVLRGRLQFVVDNLGLSMDIEFQVRSCNPSDGRTGAQFQNLEPRDIATLRHIITSHLSGELISVGDVLSTLQRDNFTKARKQKDGGSGLSAFGRFKAVTVTLGVFVVGVAAFGFVAKSLYGMYFVSHAEAGVVAVPTTSITMPRDGTVNSLVEPGGMVVKARRWPVSAPACWTCSRATWTTRSWSRPRSKNCSASNSPAPSPAPAIAWSPANWWTTASTPPKASRSSS